MDRALYRWGPELLSQSFPLHLDGGSERSGICLECCLQIILICAEFQGHIKSYFGYEWLTV